ncbi:hypothetical protein [Mycoplasma suis]|nr:hypothetical protein [Mycoplasma suis]
MLWRHGIYVLVPVLGASAPITALLLQDSNLVNTLVTSLSSAGGA